MDGAMGKMTAYLGPETHIASIAEGGSYSLVKQAEDFPDGFGFGWYPVDGNPEPLQLHSRLPIWGNDYLLRVVRRYQSQCFMASVRKAAHLPAGRQAGVANQAAGNIRRDERAEQFARAVECLHMAGVRRFLEVLDDVLERRPCGRQAERLEASLRDFA